VFSLASHHTFAFPYFAKDVISITQNEELAKFLTNFSLTKLIILGEGSNTVFLENYDGLILQPCFKGIRCTSNESHYLLKIGAGENWHKFVLWCTEQKIHGLENLALIPGTVGAAPIQNIGAYGVEIAKFVAKVDYYDLCDGQYKSLNGQECKFGYRDSIFKNVLAGKVIITSVSFAIPKVWQAVVEYGELKSLKAPSAQNILNKVVELRKSKLPDPAKIGNAGSFFKNPVIDKSLFESLQAVWPLLPAYPVNTKKVKVPAAWLIDQLGFKGQKIGGVACHTQQALVLTNDGTGTGEQLLELARKIKAKVFSEFSIELENEVRLIGKHGPVSL
jgi:UDP-N-acetylmuramate dehydrogenase